MSKKEETATSEAAVAPADRVPALAPVAVFRDKAYTSRTLVLPSGETTKVTAGRITATSPELRSYLDKHSEFERIED
ncbi:hypothetical protein [Pseudomonas sp. B392_1p]|uniref:hypothetical protein n=1 Tax=Pseudomonas sp. B392_1p TaxID=3457507 RepID=UPI003FD583E2